MSYNKNSLLNTNASGFGGNHQLIFGHDCHVDSLWTPLYREMFLSEFATDEDRQIARENLGILGEDEIAALISKYFTDNQQSIIDLIITELKKEGWTPGGSEEPDTPDTPTTITLSTPTNLAVSNITQTNATLSWDIVDNVSSYTVKINDTEYSGLTSNTYSISGLTAETTYTWLVKAIGDNTTYLSSNYSSSKTFTTASSGSTPDSGSDDSGEGTYDWVDDGEENY